MALSFDRWRLHRSAGALWLAAIVAASAGCRIDNRTLVATCDSASPDPGCPGYQICFDAQPIGGSDFCTPTCAEPGYSTTVACVGNAELATCDPAGTGDDPCGQTSLNCLRTNVIPESSLAAGVCLPMYPCTLDGDCRAPGSTCETTLLQQLYPEATDLAADHLSCIQSGCAARGAACLPGLTCLPVTLPASDHAPDLCVPVCASNLNCPPSFFCDRRINGPANPAFCIPGLLGFSCHTDVDCLMGACLSDDDPSPSSGLSSCSITCVDDVDCTKFDGPLGLFVCANGHCETPISYTRVHCLTNADCTADPGSVCSYETPGLSSGPSGICLRPCPVDGSCAPRGGIGHTCLPFFDRDGTSIQACSPGVYGASCAMDRECVGDLTCLSGICSVPCLTDNDCDAERWTEHSSYCEASSCVPKLSKGNACTRNAQCQSNLCSPSGTDGATTCAM